MTRSALLSAASLAAALALATIPAAAADAPWAGWRPFGVEQPKWDGDYLALSTGFEVASYGRGRTVAGPTLGLEAGRFWRDGDVVYGASASLSYMKPFGLNDLNHSSFTYYARDFAGAARFKLGYLVQPDLLVYATVGAAAQNEYWRYPLAAGGGGDQRFELRPEAGAGFVWQVNDKTRIYGEIRASAPVR